MKANLVFFAISLYIVHSVIVQRADICNECTDYMSAFDCQNKGCEWTAKAASNSGTCSRRQTIVIENSQYCSRITDYQICASTNGCAFLKSKCTTFAGCSAYIESTNADCQMISKKCISDGKVCKDTSACEDYPQELCDTLPDLNGRKCKLDALAKVCRNFICSEADESFLTNVACNAFSPSCVTTGAGCVSQLQNCADLQGTERTCPLMKGTDGFCKYVQGSSYCALKFCTEASQSLATDTLCSQFQDKCVTTGKGCISKLDVCASYTVIEASRDCIGYIGTDGVCEGDSGQTTCRARKCENFNGTTNNACSNYKNGCVTDGKKCVSQLQKCENYSQSNDRCDGMIGSDGFCTQSSQTGPCRLKDCLSDSQITMVTDYQCQTIQNYCVTTGAGCVAILSSCSSYKAQLTDGSDCLNRIGLEGSCKKGEGLNCTARLCTDAPLTFTTNDDCKKFQKGCVTNGAGCISERSCLDTVLEATCLGTKENSAFCNWNAICVNNTSCSTLPTSAICSAYKTSNQIRCTWDNQVKICRESKCSDFQGQNEIECTDQLPGCVSNGKNCIDPGDCSQLIGNLEKCLQLSHYCWGGNEETSACYQRTCDNAPKNYTSDFDCQQYLSSCLANTSGCIDKTKDCSQYIGTDETCQYFTGYISETQRGKCWSDSKTSGPCVQKSCSLAISPTNDEDCNHFLEGCKYNGNSSCVEPSAPCNSYSYTTDNTLCQHFRGLNGTVLCWPGNYGSCKNKECNDFTGLNPTIEQCQNFFPGCVTNGTTCVVGTTPCTSFTGTIDQCNQLVGNSIKCTKFIVCKSRICSEKTNAATNSDCEGYHSKCRLTQGSSTCLDAQDQCQSYKIVANTSAPISQLYCNSVTTISGTTCAFDPSTIGNCVARTQCKQWVTGITNVTCANYLGNKTCIQNTQDNVCYSIGACTTYNIPTANITNTTQSVWCAGLQDTSNTSCVYDSKLSTTTCQQSTYSTSCEAINVSANSITSSSGCNKIFNSVKCLYYGSKCYTTQSACTLYTVTGITVGQESTYCTALKQDNGGVVAPCKFVSKATTCSAMVCSDIVTPTSQLNCNTVPGCKYYSGACYSIVACTAYTFPTAINTDALKRLFCQNMYNTGTTNYCTFATGTTCAASVSDCTGFTGSNVATCTAFRDQTGKICTWTTGTKCAISSNLCTDVPGTVSDNNYCDLRTVPGLCKKATGTTCTVNTNTVTCTSTVATGANDVEKAAFCAARMNTTGVYCSFSIGGTNCAASITGCSSLIVTSTVDNTAFCKANKDQYGNQCTYDMNQTSCRIISLCETAISPGSQVDCDFYSTGCIYYKSQCYATKSNCNLYLSIGNASTDKLNYCNSLKTSAGGACTYLIGSSYCINLGVCTSYSVTSISAFSDRMQSCATALTTESKCTYWSNAQNSCVILGDCSTYLISSENGTDCTQMKDKNGKQCIPGSNGTSCSLKDKCESILSPKNQSDCDIYLSGCIFYQNQCITPSSTCAYPATGNNSIQFCSGLRNSSTDVLCTAASDTAVVCLDRTCSDPPTITMTTNSACTAYYSKCKSNGTKCIDATIKCADYSPNSCEASLDYDNLAPCQVALFTCIDRTCEQNQVAKTDQECEMYKSGCKTKGIGCIDPAAVCSQYIGTISECQNFVGNDIKCWGNSDSGTDSCKDRECQDNITAISDSECDLFLKDCISNGTGCVPNNSDCSLFQGDQNTCQKFKGGFCWNTKDATSTTPCLNKECSQLEGKTDLECEKFLPTNNKKSACVTNGKNCVPSTQLCSEFKGTYDTCPHFNAADGPCQGTTSSVIGDFCYQRVCSEAPNTYTTDAQCQLYHSTCLTTGKGCASSKGSICESIQNSNSCTAQIGCLWANHCRASPVQCNALQSQGQSVCVNTLLNDGKTKCVWSSSNECRKSTCADLDSSFTKHSQCNSIDPTCTTSGAGCVTQGPCDSYKIASVCAAAKTNEYFRKCFWDGDAGLCKSQSCLDDCDGKSVQSCQSYDGNQAGCIKDSNGNPCQYVKGKCYNYTSCTSITTATSLKDCQDFNPLCVYSTSSCIAQRACEQYTSVQECTIGIHNARCGWLPEGKCQNFVICQDATGTSLTDCKNYGISCITDGNSCLAKTSCQFYKTQTACSFDGTDGKCYWDEYSYSCRLATCSDFNFNTDSDCAQQIVDGLICTTNGNNCVARQSCQEYDSEQACTVGKDGIECIYGHKEGEPEGQNSCRSKLCKDVRLFTNEQCKTAIKGRKCVSNGQRCDSIDVCANYKNQISCNAGGSDGECAFIPFPTAADPLAGVCQLFSSCQSANNDQIACLRKSIACQWTSTVSLVGVIQTSCSQKTCAQAANGTQCNFISNFDQTSFTVCALVNNVCTASDASVLDSQQCYSKSAYTYTWNQSTERCVPCKIQNIQNNSANNSTQSNQTGDNSSSSTATSNGQLCIAAILLTITLLF